MTRLSADEERDLYERVIRIEERVNILPCAERGDAITRLDNKLWTWKGLCILLAGLATVLGLKRGG